MSESGTDPVVQAATRLEMAVERLGRLAASRMRELAVLRSEPGRGGTRPGEGIPREAVLAVAERLDATIARLRTALGEEGAAAVLDEQSDDLPPEDLGPEELVPDDLPPEDVAEESTWESTGDTAGHGFAAAPAPLPGGNEPPPPFGQAPDGPAFQQPESASPFPPDRQQDQGAPPPDDQPAAPYRPDDPGVPDRPAEPRVPDRSDEPRVPDRHD